MHAVAASYLPTHGACDPCPLPLPPTHMVNMITAPLPLAPHTWCM